MLLVMAPETNGHLDAEELDEYSLGKTPESDAHRIEEHLLLCDGCRQRLDRNDSYVRTMRQASARVRQEPAPENWLRSANLFRFMALAAAIVIFVVASIWALRSNRLAHQPAVVIALEANRSAGIEAKLPVGAPLVLQPDLQGLAPSPSYWLEMVDGEGRAVWSGVYPPGNVPPQPPGTYFVRLYSSAGELLREYGLTLRRR